MKKKKLRLIFPMLAVVEFYFLVPVAYAMAVAYGKQLEAETATVGYLFLETSGINIFFQVLLLIWPVGAVFQLIFYVWKLIRMNYGLRKSCFPVEPNIRELFFVVKEHLKLRQNITVSYSYMARSPMVIGSVRKKIVLPTRKYSQKELEVIFSHELLHVQQKAIWMKQLSILIRIIHWVNPIAYCLLRELDEWGETACDMAVRYQSGYVASFREYFQIIIDGMEVESQVPDIITQFNKTKGIDERVMKMRNYKRENDFKRVSGALAMLMFLLFCTSTVYAAETGLEGAYNIAYNSTVDQVVEVGDVNGNNLIEYVEDWYPNQDEMVEVPAQNWLRSTKRDLNWTVPKKTALKTEIKSLKAGGSIYISLSVYPNDKEILAGVITPDYKKRYVTITGAGAHTFDLTVDGTYYVFIENNNSVEITTAGYCTY